MKIASAKAEFDQRYQTHLKHLKLKGLQPKTIDAYVGETLCRGEAWGATRIEAGRSPPLGGTAMPPLGPIDGL